MKAHLMDTHLVLPKSRSFSEFKVILRSHFSKNSHIWCYQSQGLFRVQGYTKVTLFEKRPFSGAYVFHPACFLSDALEEYFKMVMAGFAGSPQMISATLFSLTRIMYEFKGILLIICIIYFFDPCFVERELTAPSKTYSIWSLCKWTLIISVHFHRDQLEPPNYHIAWNHEHPEY